MQTTDRPAFLSGLYRRYADDLAAVIAQQRAFLDTSPTVVPQLDDVEAELTYLLLRHHRPAHVVEIGTHHGWSTTWMLSALRDNGHGHLHSFDLVDHVRRSVPPELARDRWTFHRGDVRDTADEIPADTGYLFVDADHGRRFARWYLANLFPRITRGTPTSVHDVFHLRWARPFTEGAEVLRWLRERDVDWFTAARPAARGTLRLLDRVRAEIGLTGARGTATNPMIFFEMV
ncbi:class I SAM-dependent methyltransferase [Pseudonocardia sp. NPDC049635]|uniref:class I SAM-dependent methyltransferase n=1 Tax=Pseudonocardia sp. NPDC049635 TaxID=3155506 RepID=UPI0033EFC4CF